MMLDYACRPRRHVALALDAAVVQCLVVRPACALPATLGAAVPCQLCTSLEAGDTNFAPLRAVLQAPACACAPAVHQVAPASIFATHSTN